MSWLPMITLAVLAMGALLALGAPRALWQAPASALLLGLAGYALQAHPGLAGAPKAPVETVSDDARGMVEARNALAGQVVPQGNRYLVIGDAMVRHGQYADAATVLLGAVEANPKDGEAWLALANALAGHAEGALTPASLYAYRKAMAAAPDHPGPPFFLGLALARSGRLAEARDIWARLLAATPQDAPWRKDLAQRLGELDQFIARQAQSPPQG